MIVFSDHGVTGKIVSKKGAVGGKCFRKSYAHVTDIMYQEMRVANVIMNANSPHLIKVYEIGPKHIDYELLTETWRDGIESRTDQKDLLVLYTKLRRDPTAEASIAKQLIEFRRLGIVYFDLHLYNIGRQASEPHDWRIFDFNCSWLVNDEPEFMDWIEAYADIALPSALRGLAAGIGTWKLGKDTNPTRAVKRFREAWKEQADNPNPRPIVLRSGKRVNGLGPDTTRDLQRAIATQDIDALRYFYIFGRPLGYNVS